MLLFPLSFYPFQPFCTGAVALCVMSYWNKQLVNRLKKLEIEFDVYEGYVDDVTFVTDELKAGSRIENNVLIVDEEKKELDKEKHGDEITVDIIDEVAQSITKMIKVTFETPLQI